MIDLNGKSYTWVGYNQNGQGVFSDRSGGVPSSFSYLTSKVNVGTGKTDSSVKWNLSIPIVTTTDSACACPGDILRTYYVRMEIVEPAGASAAERLDLGERIKDLTASAEFQASVVNLVQPSA